MARRKSYRNKKGKSVGSSRGRTTPRPLPGGGAQAIAYKGRIKNLLIGYFQQVAKSERSTIKVILEQQGHTDIAKNIEDI